MGTCAFCGLANDCDSDSDIRFCIPTDTYRDADEDSCHRFVDEEDFILDIDNIIGNI
ncbi:MAG: hypothetical protein PVG39_24175 [Desulfobacteraceae bacterium]|jgi:hypothetical protein